MVGFWSRVWVYDLGCFPFLLLFFLRRLIWSRGGRIVGFFCLGLPFLAVLSLGGIVGCGGEGVSEPIDFFLYLSIPFV